METILALRIATLNTRLHLTTAHRVRRCPVIRPNSIRLHSRTLAQLAVMDLKPTHELAFTIIPGTSPAPVFTEPITMKKWSTHLIWTCHRAITPSRLPVIPTDMSIGIKMLLCPTREPSGLYLLISESPPPQLNGTVHSTTPVVSHNK